jgi:hypothetical protein
MAVQLENHAKSLARGAAGSLASADRVRKIARSAKSGRAMTSSMPLHSPQPKASWYGEITVEGYRAKSVPMTAAARVIELSDGKKLSAADGKDGGPKSPPAPSAAYEDR